MSVHAINLTVAEAAANEAGHALYFLNRIARQKAGLIEPHAYGPHAYTVAEMEAATIEHQLLAARYYAEDRAIRGLTISD